jgi:serine phosphatase RsbU (regulator of sigma subunit)
VSEGNLWILVADFTGHGYIAHLLASGLQYVWRMRRIAQLRNGCCTPVELLSALGRELEAVLPDEVFVEAVLGLFSRDGRVFLVGAGCCSVAVRRRREPGIELHEFGGYYLGIEQGERDQRALALEVGDEVLLASDGLYEQPCGENRMLKADLPRRLGPCLAPGRELHDAILEILTEVLEACSQQDDITVVTVSHCATSSQRGNGRVAV